MRGWMGGEREGILRISLWAMGSFSRDTLAAAPEDSDFVDDFSEVEQGRLGLMDMIRTLPRGNAISIPSGATSDMTEIFIPYGLYILFGFRHYFLRHILIGI